MSASRPFRSSQHDGQRRSYTAVVSRAQREVMKMRRRAGGTTPDFVELARRWANDIECNDEFTQGHCDRVADIACALAVADGFTDERLYWFRVGALLHDIGKFVVPAEVLNKAGRLSAEEWDVVRSHPRAGVEMVQDVAFPGDVMDILLSHHERWDGSGYPHGLAGEAIPHAARIVAIADAYDAITSVRSYKDALAHDTAMAVLRIDVGRHFDPRLFAAFERVISGAGIPFHPSLRTAPVPAR